MKIDPLQRDLIGWGVIGAVGIVVGYVLLKYVLPGLAGTATSSIANTLNAAFQGLSSNNLTKSQTNLAGQSVDYSGYGPASTLGAAANAALAGVPASVGQTVGNNLFSLFGDSAPASNVTFIVNFPDGSRHAIDSSLVDSNNRFSYNGQTYVLGDDGTGKKLATALSTVYGSGSGGGADTTTDFGVTNPGSW